MTTESQSVLLEVKDLVKHFPVNKGSLFQKNVNTIKAVDGVDFTIRQKEAFGLVGESGCGKSTTGRLVMRLIEPTSGKIFLEGRNILELSRKEMRRLRKDIQIIFQDPYGSINPRMTVGEIVGEPMYIHGLARGAAKERRVRELLEVVGLASSYARRKPHEFSGGQRQRIGIARALSVNPKILICDEPTSALDVSIQAQVINLLQDLKQEFGLTYLFISHDLSLVKHVSNHVAVMYLGKIVELSEKADLYRNPQHPYTQSLLSVIPIPDPTFKRKRIILEGAVPSPLNPPSGCRFHTRCPIANQGSRMGLCLSEMPPLRMVKTGHWVACHFVEESDMGKFGA